MLLSAIILNLQLIFGIGNVTPTMINAAVVASPSIVVVDTTIMM